MNSILRLLYCFVIAFENRDTLIELMEEQEIKRLKDEYEAQKDFVKLCARHQPIKPGSIFDECNCDVCKLLKVTPHEKTTKKQENS